jgi:hypothetical protein
VRIEGKCNIEPEERRRSSIRKEKPMLQKKREKKT